MSREPSKSYILHYYAKTSISFNWNYFLLTFAMILCGGFPTTLFSQTEPEQETEEPPDLRVDRFYQRIAVVPLFVNFGNLKEADYNFINATSTPARFDRHNIPTKIIRSNFNRNDYTYIPATSSTPRVNREQRTKLYQDLLHQERIGNQVFPPGLTVMSKASLRCLVPLRKERNTVLQLKTG
jgi:hypothetical protein